MKKYYEKVSLLSRLINFSFKFSKQSKNYLTKENTIEFMNRYKSFKENYNLYEQMNFEKEKIDFLDIYTYNGSIKNNKGKILLYIHGGSFLEEAVSYQLNFAMKIAKNTNSTLVVPRYKLIPEGNYKTMYEDISKLYRIILDNCTFINFLGDSSGGGFILSFSMYLRDNELLLPKNILMLSPWLDLSMENPELIKSSKNDNMSEIEGNKYCGKLWAHDLSVKDWAISAIYGDFKKLPMITIMTGSYDILKPDCLKLSKKLDELGIEHNYIEYKNQGHDFGCYPTKEGKLLIEDIISIIKKGD